MGPDQCREARALLRWTQHELAKAADVPLWFVVAFEDADAPAFLAHYEIDLREALEDAGVRFDGDDVTYAPKGKGEVH